jgi:hypothetical protein
MWRHEKYETKDNMTTLNINNSIVMDIMGTNDNEVGEIPKSSEECP